MLASAAGTASGAGIGSRGAGRSGDDAAAGRGAFVKLVDGPKRCSGEQIP